MTSNREPTEKATTEFVQRWLHEVWSHGIGDVATAVNDRSRRAVLRVDDEDYTEALYKYRSSERAQRKRSRRTHPS